MNTLKKQRRLKVDSRIDSNNREISLNDRALFDTGVQMLQHPKITCLEDDLDPEPEPTSAA